MKATDSAQAFGAVIGKALKPLREGQGLIPIWLHYNRAPAISARPILRKPACLPSPSGPDDPRILAVVRREFQVQR